MQIRPRFLGRLGLADAVTVTGAAVGFLAVVATSVDAGLAARLILLAAIADGLDGVVARTFGSTPAGSYLDSLADVASFCVAPAVLVASFALETWTLDGDPYWLVAGLGLPTLFLAMGVVRLGLYTAYDSDASETEGVQTTLAATILSAAVLAGHTDPAILVVGTGILAVLMVSRITYPDLHPQDALVMGVVQFLAIVFTGFLGEAFAFALLFLSLAYLVFGPRFYWET